MFIRATRIWLGLVAIAAAVGLSGCATTAHQPAKMQEKVVYHFNDSSTATAGMNNIKNHLSAAPDAEIVVVTHGKGIDFLLDGAADKDGNPYNIKVEELQAQGVDFRVCNNTLVSRKIDPKTVLPQVKIIPSGVAEIGKLQAKEGFVYLKP